MEFGLSEIQNGLQESVSRFLEEEASLDRVRQFAESDKSLAKEIWSGIAELGVTGTLIDEKYGGVGLSAMDAATIAECLGNHVTPVPFLGTCVITPRALALAGSDSQREDILPKIAEGELTFGLGLSPACAPRGKVGLTKKNDRLSGSIQFVSDPSADGWLVVDRSRQLHLVFRGADGIEVKDMPQVDRTRPVCAMEFNHVPCETLPDSNEQVLQHLLDLAWVAIAFDTLGASQSMLDQAVEYAMQRKQFNRVIASFQAVKHMCAEMAAELEPTRSMLWYAAHALDAEPEESHLLACHAKAHMSEVGTFIGRTATIVHGGMGFTDLLGLHYWFKRIGFNRQYLGGPEWLREQAAIAQNLVA